VLALKLRRVKILKGEGRGLCYHLSPLFLSARRRGKDIPTTMHEGKYNPLDEVGTKKRTLGLASPKIVFFFGDVRGEGKGKSLGYSCVLEWGKSM